MGEQGREGQPGGALGDGVRGRGGDGQRVAVGGEHGGHLVAVEAGVGQHRSAAEDDPVDAEQRGEVGGAHAEQPGRARPVAAAHGPQAQGLQAAAVAARARRPVHLHHLVAELPRAGAPAPVHLSAEHQPRAQADAQVQIAERLRAGAGCGGAQDGQRGGVRVLVHGDVHDAVGGQPAAPVRRTARCRTSAGGR